MKKKKSYLIFTAMFMLFSTLYTNSIYGQSIESEINDDDKNKRKISVNICYNPNGEVTYNNTCVAGQGQCIANPCQH